VQRYEKYFVPANKINNFEKKHTKILPIQKKAVPLHAFSPDGEKVHIVPLAIELGSAE